MISSILFAPQTPLLEPSVAGRAAFELDPLRESLSEATSSLIASTDEVVIIATESADKAVAFIVQGQQDQQTTVVKLLADPPFSQSVRVNPDSSKGELKAIDEVTKELKALDSSTKRVGVIVLGDGSAKRTEKAPGFVDHRAVAFDNRLSEIFHSAQLSELSELDFALARELWVWGIDPWMAIGKFVSQSGAQFSLENYFDTDPYGVEYFVAGFSRTT